MIVYLIVCLVTGKRYIGKSKRDLERRWYEHVYHAHTMSTKMVLYAAIRKHGADAFEKSVLEEGFATVAEMNEAEKRLIAELKPEYNMTKGGDGLEGYNHTPETKAKMSESRKKPGGIWNRGTPMREETKKKLSKALSKPRPNCPRRGIPIHSEEYKQRLAEERYVKVVQYDLHGNALATYLSLKDAQMITGIQFQNISRACRFSHRTAGGFKWQYLSLNPKD